jgi:virginiamycin A acetyltransferase
MTDEGRLNLESREGSSASSQPPRATAGSPAEGVQSGLGRWIARVVYPGLPVGWRPWARRCVLRLEKGPVYSRSVREILARYHGVEVGLYTIGPCETDPDQFAAGTVIGRYCSVYYTARILASDGPVEILPAGGPAWSLRPRDPRPTRPAGAGLVVGHDVYIGHNAVILPSVRRIGHGAVIGAGSVVHEDVPPYAVVTGNPARVVRYRFRPETIQHLLQEQWWLKSIDELVASGRPLNARLEQDGRPGQESRDL